MPEGTEAKPAMSGGTGGGGFSFLGNFSQGFFSKTNTKTIDQVDNVPANDSKNLNSNASAGSPAGFRRVKTLSDFSKMTIPEEGSSGKAAQAPISQPKASVDATGAKQGSGEGGLGGIRRVSFGDFTKTFANLNNKNSESESLKPPDTASQPRRGSSSVIWEWLNTSTTQQDMAKPESSMLGRRHSSAIPELPEQQQQQQQQQQPGMGKKKVLYRDLNAYAPSNW